MKTFARGNVVIGAEGLTLEQAVAIADDIEAYRKRQEVERHLAAVDYGHDFGKNYLCQCGMERRDYDLNNKNRTVCPLYGCCHRGR